MIFSGLIFFILSFVTYTLVALFGQLTGGSGGGFWDDVIAVFKPLPLLVLLVSNLFFAAALSFGFKFSTYAIPMAIAIGVIASFVYSTVFLGGVVTWIKVLGVVVILVGIYLLK